MKKKLLIAGICVAAAALSIAGVLLYFHNANQISYSGSIPAGVRARLVIERDARGTPVIIAQNFNDAYFALGFLHAQDRYDIMEYFRALAAGYSAALVGEDGAALDRLSRAVDFAGRGSDIAARIGGPYAGYLADYARGVNEARARLHLKDAVPRDWSAGDIIAVLALREWCNAFLNNREALFPFQRDSSVTGLKALVPEDLISYYRESESDSVGVVARTRALVAKYAGIFDRGFAFYLPAQRVKENYPVTAYSFEDMLSVYPGWYPVHLHCADRIIKGITHTGFPFIFAGSNLDLSFYGFSAGMDVQDLIAETIIRIGDTYQYLGPLGWRDFTTASAGEGGAPIHRTENGPVLNDIFENSGYGSSVVTVRSAFFGPEYIASLFEIPFSRSIAEAGLRARGIMSPPRVYLFATDTEARRAWSGMVPVRRKTDAMLRTGYDSAWTGMIDLSLLPEAAGGNGALAAGSSFLSDAPAAVRGLGVAQEFRHRRLLRLLERKPRFTDRDVLDVLADRHSAIARMFLPEFLEILGSNPMASARLSRVYFQNWKYQVSSDFNGPSIFHKLLQQFMYETVSDELRERADGLLERWDLLAPNFYRLVKENKSPLFDDRSTYRTEYRETIFDRAFLTTMRFFNRAIGPDINDWTWGRLHRGSFSVPGAGGRPEGRPFEGGSDTILRGSLGTSLAPVEVTSLFGCFGIEQSLYQMNFRYSTNPKSRFYYGATDSAELSIFHEVHGAYVMTIEPEKK